MVPQNLRWGDGPCIGPPNILRSSVVGWAQKLQQSEKVGFRQGILFWNSAFSCEERVIYNILHSKDTENLKRAGRWLKKGHQNFWAWKWKFVSEKNVIQKFWYAKIFSVTPQTRRQVCATVFRCLSSFRTFKRWLSILNAFQDFNHCFRFRFVLLTSYLFEMFW